MTLLDAERIVRRVTETLRQPALEGRAAEAAREYADACASTARRLAQCSAMLLEGRDDRQGLQLAEVSPPLLDLITVLAFREAAEWRDYCQAHGLTIAESFDAKAIKRINAAYSQGIHPDHRLYKEYRRAIQRREDEQAVTVLRLIASLSPDDKQLAGDVRQLEDKILRKRMERLHVAMAGGGTEAILAALLEVEALPHPPAADDELWRRAQRARCGVWLEQVESLRGNRSWREAAHGLGQVKAACARHSLQLDSAAAAALARGETWVAEEKAAFQENAKFHRALADVEGLLEVTDEKLSSTRRSRTEELRQDHEDLTRRWRELEQFQREVSADLADRTSKTLRLLRAQLERKQRAGKFIIAVSVAALIIAAGGVAYLINTNRAARDFAGELKRFEQARQVVAAEKLIAQVLEKEARLAGVPEGRAAIAGAKVFIATEQQKFAELKRLAAGLAAQASGGFAGASFEQTQANFDAATRLAGGLAPEFQPAADEALASPQTRWEQYLDARRQEREREFEKNLRAAEELAAGGLKYERGPVVVRDTLEKGIPFARTLDALTNAVLPPLAVSTELRQAYASLKRRQETLAAQLAHWDKVVAALQRPTSLAGHRVALTDLQKSEFASPAQVRAAAEVTDLNVTPERLFAALLEVERGRDWTARPMSWSPETVTAEDRAKYAEVRDDLNFMNVTSCLLTQIDPVNERVVATHKAWVRGAFTTNRLVVPVGIIYLPSESPGALNFKEMHLRSYEYRFAAPVPTREFRLFERAGLRDFFDAQGHYNAGLLVALDVLNEDTEASPVFRAWLAMKLHAIVERRPNDWGEVWAPAVAAHRQQLRDLGADRIKSGDWLVPDRQARFEQSLNAHFSRARTVRYFRQATFFNQLARAVHEGGFLFVGYVDPASKPVLAPSVEAKGEWWGWTGASKTPVLLYRNGSALGGRQPMPYTPLFAPRQRRADWIGRAASAAGVTAGADEARPLPPLFVEPYE